MQFVILLGDENIYKEQMEMGESYGRVDEETSSRYCHMVILRSKVTSFR